MGVYGSGRWVWATTAGYCVGVGLSLAAGIPMASFLAQAAGWVETVIKGVFGVVLGVVLGTAQWMLLRRRARGSGWWVLANAVGYSASEATGGGGAVIGAITGLALILLLRRPMGDGEFK